MPRLSGFSGPIFLLVGLFFAFQSAPRNGAETHWGYALTGITCLILSARLLGLPPLREALTGKSSRPDPFE